MKIPKRFWGPKVGPRPHTEKGSLRSHDAAAHCRQLRPVTIWAPPPVTLFRVELGSQLVKSEDGQWDNSTQRERNINGNKVFLHAKLSNKFSTHLLC